MHILYGGVYSRTVAVATTRVSDNKSSKRLAGLSEGSCRAPVPKGLRGFSLLTTWEQRPLMGNFVRAGAPLPPPPVSYAYAEQLVCYL